MYTAPMLVFAAFATVALILIAIVRAIAWLLRRSVSRTMGGPGGDKQNRKAHGEPSHPDVADDAWLRTAVELTEEVRARKAEVAGVKAEVRRAYLWAGAAYASVVSGVMFLLLPSTFSLAGKLMAVSAALVPQLLILQPAMRLPARQRLFGWLAYVTVNAIVLPLITTPHYFWLNVRTSMPFIAFLPVPFLLIALQRRIQPYIVFLMSLIVSLVLLAAPFWNQVPEDSLARVFEGRKWLIALEVLSVVFGAYGAYGASRVLRRPSALVIVGAYVAALAGSWLLLATPHDLPIVLSIVGFVAASFLQGVLLWGIFRMLTSQRVREIVTNDIVQIHVCWTFLTLYFETSTMRLGSAGGSPGHPATPSPKREYMYDWPWTARAAFLLALVAEVLVLGLRLRAIRRRRPPLPLRKMMLLRAFGGAYRREDLLDDLEDSWRRLGSIDLLAAADLAEHTLVPSTLEAVLVGNIRSQFFHTPEDVRQGLARRELKIQPDVRYPVNAWYCTHDTWHDTFELLAPDVDIVVMDLRGFQRSNEGCAWELDYLARKYDHKRVVLITDSRTDLAFTREIVGPSVAGNSFAAVPIEQKTRAERERLFEMILSAAFV